MKSLYTGYFRPSEDEFKKMWEESIFVFDTNVLLHFYRYSEDTQKELLSILENLKDRLWIPKKVIDEFIIQRLDVLNKQVNKYDPMVSSMDDILSKLENKREHPFINQETFEKLMDLLIIAKEELLENKEKLLSRAGKDEILEKLAELIEEKIGSGFSSEELEKIYIDGETRAKDKIPPGFEDVKEKKKDPLNSNYRIYGDLVIWKEILTKSKNDKVGIIFVSDDKKEDWWLKLQGRTISPLPNLFQEFISETNGQSFYMYTVDKFVEYYGEFSKNPVSKEIIQETKEVRESHEILDAIEYWKTIEEGEFLNKLKEYEDQYADEYVGIKRFVISYLRDLHNYEPNSSYKVLNTLNSKGMIELYEIENSMGIVKAVRSVQR